MLASTAAIAVAVAVAVVAIVAVALWRRRREGYTAAEACAKRNKFWSAARGKCMSKKNCKGKVVDGLCVSANPEFADLRLDCKHRLRQLVNGAWRCPMGWSDTKLTWGMPNADKQCQKCS